GGPPSYPGRVLGQAAGADGDAAPPHRRENPDQWHLDVGEQRREAEFVEALALARAELVREPRLDGRVGDRLLAVAERKLAFVFGRRALRREALVGGRVARGGGGAARGGPGGRGPPCVPEGRPARGGRAAVLPPAPSAFASCAISGRSRSPAASAAMSSMSPATTFAPSHPAQRSRPTATAAGPSARSAGSPATASTSSLTSVGASGM